MTSDIEHTDVAAYALGVLNEQDRRTFEAHLSGCRFCTMELADLRGMRRLLTGIEPPPATTHAAVPTRVSRRRGGAQRWLFGLAASVALVLSGVGGGVALTAHDSVGPIEMNGTKLVAANGPIKGTAVVDPRIWGTWMALDMDGVTGGPFNCELIAVGKDGKEKVASGWNVPAEPHHLRVEGGVADPINDLSRLEVRADNGKTLLVIPVP